MQYEYQRYAFGLLVIDELEQHWFLSLGKWCFFVSQETCVRNDWHCAVYLDFVAGRTTRAYYTTRNILV